MQCKDFISIHIGNNPVSFPVSTGFRQQLITICLRFRLRFRILGLVRSFRTFRNIRISTSGLSSGEHEVNDNGIINAKENVTIAATNLDLIFITNIESVNYYQCQILQI